MNTKLTVAWALVFLTGPFSLFAQVTPARANDVTTPLHALQPDYPVPYRIPSVSGIRSVLDRIREYLEAATPAQFQDRVSGAVISDLNTIDTNTVFGQADFRLTSYE